MNSKVPLSELTDRLNRFRHLMDARHPDWEITIIFSKINLYYFTGTMQDGMLLIPRNGEACLWVRRSFERAEDESFFPRILPMRSYRDAATTMKTIPEAVYIETEQVPLALFRRLQKHFPFVDVTSIDKEILQVRSIKSPYELALMEQAGDIHRRVLEDLVP